MKRKEDQEASVIQEYKMLNRIEQEKAKAGLSLSPSASLELNFKGIEIE